MRRPPRTPRRTPGRVAPLAPVDGDQAAALDRLRAALGPVEVVEVRAHQADPGRSPAQGELFDLGVAG